MKSKPKIHIVSQSKFPKYARKIKGLQGCQYGNQIYVRKDARDVEAIKQHELYHIKKRHPLNPRKASDYIDQELDANLYAKNKTGLHKHIKHRIVGIATSVRDDYKMPIRKTVRLVAKEMRRKDVPREWKDDFNHVVGKQLYKGKRLPKDLRL